MLCRSGRQAGFMLVYGHKGKTVKNCTAGENLQSRDVVSRVDERKFNRHTSIVTQRHKILRDSDPCNYLTRTLKKPAHQFSFCIGICEGDGIATCQHLGNPMGFAKKPGETSNTRYSLSGKSLK